MGWNGIFWPQIKWGKTIKVVPIMLINLLSSQKLERKKWVEKLAAGGRRGPRKRESRKSDLPAGKAWRLLPVGKKKCWVLLLGPCHTYVVGIGRVIYSILTFWRILKTSKSFTELSNSSNLISSNNSKKLNKNNTVRSERPRDHN